MQSDAVVVFLVGLFVYLISSWIDLFEKMVDFTRRYEKWELDEIISLSLILALCLLVFSARRWRDLAYESRMKGEALEKNKALINELRETLDTVKRLEGLIPICSNCHSIRDDKGYWHRVEKYLQERTDASFSHSICPKCVKELYPEIYDKIIMEEQENEE